MAGRRIWAGAKGLAKSTIQSWEWDVWFGYMTAGWQKMDRTGPLNLNSDGLWLSGEDCSYYNFLDPRTEQNVWSPMQVTRTRFPKKQIEFRLGIVDF